MSLVKLFCLLEMGGEKQSRNRIDSMRIYFTVFTQTNYIL